MNGPRMTRQLPASSIVNDQLDLTKLYGCFKFRPESSWLYLKMVFAHAELVRPQRDLEYVIWPQCDGVHSSIAAVGGKTDPLLVRDDRMAAHCRSELFVPHHVF